MREVDEAVIEELRVQMTEESFVRAVFGEVRRHLIERTRPAESDEAPKLEEQIKIIRAEQANLAQAIAMARGSLPGLRE